ncbi:MAG: BON domain-containing protein [Gammaproteobacteria bacterium]
MNRRWLFWLLLASAVLQGCGSMLLGAPAPSGAPESDEELRVSLQDDTITAEVRSALRRDSNLRRGSIWVKTDRGVVTLSGSVDSYQLRDYAATIAAGVRNVVAIDNRLQVGSGSAFP